MIALVALLALAAPDLPTIPAVPTTSTASTSSRPCDGLCGEYRTEMIRERQHAKDLMSTLRTMAIGRETYKRIAGKCIAGEMTRPIPECPSVVGWTAGGCGAGIAVGVAVSAGICASASHAVP